jgi:hypothetical protein
LRLQFATSKNSGVLRSQFVTSKIPTPTFLLQEISRNVPLPHKRGARAHIYLQLGNADFRVGSEHFAESFADFPYRGISSHRTNYVRHGVRGRDVAVG